MGVVDVVGLLDLEHPFPLGDDRRRHRIAHHVGRGAAHVEELVDGEDDRHALHGKPEHGERAGDDDQRSARHRSDALGGNHQRQQDQDLRVDAEIDAIGLRDEDRREAHVHHRTVEIERVAQRQHEARDAARHAEAVELLEQLGQRGLGRGGRKGDHQRLADVADQRPDARAKEQSARAQQDHPQEQQREVELGQQREIGAEDRQPARRHDIGESAEHRDRRVAHHVARHLQHHLGQRIGAGDQRLAALANRRQGDACKDREDEDLQDIVGRQRLDRVLGEDREDELGRLQLLDLADCGGGGGDIGDRRADAGLEEVDQHQPEADRDEARGNEPRQRAHADAAQGGAVAHMGDADDDGREHQRRNQHLDEVEEDVAQKLEPRRDLFLDHVGGQALVEHLADDHAEHHAGKDVEG